MINRRHIRIKVMQSAYALLQSKSDDLNKEEKFLFASIDKMHDLYALLLQLLVEVKNLEKKHIEISKNKYLATQEELNPKTNFVDNAIFQILEDSTSLKEYCKKQKLKNWELDNEYVTEIWKKIKKSDVYFAYMKEENPGFEKDKNFVLDFYKEIVAPNNKLFDYFEDQNISWLDDIPFVNTLIVKSVNKLNQNRPFQMGALFKDEEDEKFVTALFRKTVLNHTEYEKDIVDKTPNWDAERIAEVDMLLIKMAICEFVAFPSIPTRVTINEYIEIAKDYSTDKSSYFVNGVLDKILKEFTSSKRLHKIGRGLL